MNNPKLVRVQDIILDELHPRYNGQSSIGNILYTDANSLTPPVGALLNSFIAKPFNKNISHYPVPNELLYVISSPGPTYNEDKRTIKYYLHPLSIQQAPSSNALPDQVKKLSREFYQGQYFKEQAEVRPLRPYEGDVIIEGRFGNSIRFGSTINNDQSTHPNKWSNEGEVGKPIILLRNGQHNDLEANSFDHIIEDINGDDSSIYLCSSQQISNFTPSSFHDASYGEDIYKEEKKEEVNQTNTSIDEGVEEDIILDSSNNLPPEELQNNDELADFEGGETAQFDNSPTDPQTIGENDTRSVPANIDVPNNISDGDLNLVLGMTAPPAIQDNTDYSGGNAGFGGL